MNINIYALSVLKKVPYFLMWKIYSRVQKSSRNRVIFWMELIVFHLTRVAKYYFSTDLVPFLDFQNKRRIHFSLGIYKKKRLFWWLWGSPKHWGKPSWLISICWIHQLKTVPFILCFHKQQKPKYRSFIINKLEII